MRFHPLPTGLCVLLFLSAVVFAIAHPGETKADDARFTTSRPSPLTLPLPEEKNAFFFVVFGDRTTGPPEGIQVLAQAVKDVNLLAPDLVMTVGDLVQGYTDEPHWLVEATEYKATMSPLKCPWFPVVGNHDLYWRGKGERPKGENEHLFETHFGPLWYAFEHKNSWFIALDSDEGDPTTGDHAFDHPAAQTMSEAQFTWLTQTLERARSAENIFVFLHHPRWLRGNYGDDWDRVHQLLAKNGNVRAVFAGHIHRMRYDGVRDGIEYFTLATVGGQQDGFASKAGYLHQYDVVTVRDKKISITSYPVGVAMDPRGITGVVSDEVATLAKSLVTPHFSGSAAFGGDLSVDGEVELKVSNPTSRPVEMTLTPDSRDSRWMFSPDHEHELVKPGGDVTFHVGLRRPPSTVDAFFGEPKVTLSADYLAETMRVPLLDHEWTLPVDGRTLPAPPKPTTESVLVLDGAHDCLSVASDKLALPDGPLTVEGWFDADSWSSRVGFLNKTEGSEYGIFLSNGVPSFSLHLDGKYVNVPAGKQPISTHAWHHVAATFDGKNVRLFVDGELAAEKPGHGKRTPNDLALMIGADVTKEGGPESFFAGQIDEVRISKVARYSAAFTPARRFEADGDTILLLHMDGSIGPWAYDSSGRGVHAMRVGNAHFAPAQ